MIGWVTDNLLSRTVMNSIPGIEIKHINYFNNTYAQPGIFYGILRGASRAMHILEEKNINYYYIDNGYFDALYVDKNMHKSMEGKFRVVKNGMHDVYINEPSYYCKPENKTLLILPPSAYSANFYDTTPEDWIAWAAGHAKQLGWEIKIRHKTEISPLENDLAWCGGVLSFNSMVSMRAIALGKVVCDTHGMFLNAHLLQDYPCYEMDNMRKFYEPKQFTLEELKQGKYQWI